MIFLWWIISNFDFFLHIMIFSTTYWILFCIEMDLISLYLPNIYSIYNQNTIKPARVVTSIKQSTVLKVTFVLSCRSQFHMNWTSFKRSPVLKDHFFFVPKVTSEYRLNCKYTFRKSVYYTVVCIRSQKWNIKQKINMSDLT